MSNINVIGGIYEAGRYPGSVAGTTPAKENRNASFESLFESAKTQLNETNSLTNAAEEQEINYAMGLSSNVHDLQVAQQKASISLQYTVAVRNSVVDAYKEIMNLQF